MHLYHTISNLGYRVQISQKDKKNKFEVFQTIISLIQAYHTFSNLEYADQPKRQREREQV